MTHIGFQVHSEVTVSDVLACSHSPMVDFYTEGKKLSVLTHLTALSELHWPSFLRITNFFERSAVQQKNPCVLHFPPWLSTG